MINLYRTKKDFKNFVTTHGKNKVGLVPTMGNLHAGHLSLIEESLKDNELTIITIFVNPKQFGPGEDFDSYPRTLDNDLAIISTLKRKFIDKAITVLAPINAFEIYPDDFSTIIHVDNYMANILCGKSRPDHFKGVTTVVYKLFSLSQATVAYFGQKDFQQFKIIEKMVQDLEIDIDLKMMPIVRQENGLALSSRNQYLKNQEKNESLKLKNTILSIETLIKNAKIDEAIRLCKSYEENEYEYLKVLNSKTLKEIDKNTTNFVVLGAIKIGKTRLIDNTIFKL